MLSPKSSDKKIIQPTELKINSAMFGKPFDGKKLSEYLNSLDCSKITSVSIDARYLGATQAEQNDSLSAILMHLQGNLYGVGNHPPGYPSTPPAALTKMSLNNFDFTEAPKVMAMPGANYDSDDDTPRPVRPSDLNFEDDDETEAVFDGSAQRALFSQINTIIVTNKSLVSLNLTDSNMKGCTNGIADKMLLARQKSEKPLTITLTNTNVASSSFKETSRPIWEVVGQGISTKNLDSAIVIGKETLTLRQTKDAVDAKKTVTTPTSSASTSSSAPQKPAAPPVPPKSAELRAQYRQSMETHVANANMGKDDTGPKPTK